MMTNVCRANQGGVEADKLAVMVTGDGHTYERELVATHRRSDEALEPEETAERTHRLADRRKNRSLVTLAHAFRNRFSAMRSTIDLLARQEGLPHDAIWRWNARSAARSSHAHCLRTRKAVLSLAGAGRKRTAHCRPRGAVGWQRDTIAMFVEEDEI